MTISSKWHTHKKQKSAIGRVYHLAFQA